MSFPQISTSPAPISATEPSSGFADFVLRHLDVARVEARLVLNHINTVAVALKGGLIDSETALAMLGEVESILRGHHHE